ncbi:hypothetical protein NX722_28455 [Endozoicomonas gorgoniicola]|uniref:TMhelix containing protein n=1 Tax=Endozoicomonas gorgoniicola TaxID=1234144 RepID=A0ABT3N5N0_9GAMM|nr:hypothetical protein [Endozoicomonas gorgoniicola]MCW7556499.1 hypothetical protein [Endozoicomonas gorgoniicola]
MMSFIGRLFGSDKAISTTADGIYKGIDAAFFTNEEKSQHFLKLLKAYEPFKLAQRLLALIVGIPYVLIWMTCAVMLVISAFMEPCGIEAVCSSNNVLEAAKTLADWNNETLGFPFSLILGFYFGGGAVEGVVRARSSK